MPSNTNHLKSTLKKAYKGTKNGLLSIKKLLHIGKKSAHAKIPEEFTSQNLQNLIDRSLNDYNKLEPSVTELVELTDIARDKQILSNDESLQQQNTNIALATDFYGKKNTLSEIKNYNYSFLNTDFVDGADEALKKYDNIKTQINKRFQIISSRIIDKYCSDYQSIKQTLEHAAKYSESAYGVNILSDEAFEQECFTNEQILRKLNTDYNTLTEIKDNNYLLPNNCSFSHLKDTINSFENLLSANNEIINNLNNSKPKIIDRYLQVNKEMLKNFRMASYWYEKDNTVNGSKFDNYDDIRKELDGLIKTAQQSYELLLEIVNNNYSLPNNINHSELHRLESKQQDLWSAEEKWKKYAYKIATQIAEQESNKKYPIYFSTPILTTSPLSDYTSLSPNMQSLANETYENSQDDTETASEISIPSNLQDYQQTSYRQK